MHTHSKTLHHTVHSQKSHSQGTGQLRLRCQLRFYSWWISIHWNSSLQSLLLFFFFPQFIQRLLKTIPAIRLSYVLSVFTSLFPNCIWRILRFGSKKEERLWLIGKHFTSRATAFADLCQADNCSSILWVDCRDRYSIVLFSISFMNAKAKSGILPLSQLESLSRLSLLEAKSNTVNQKHFWFLLTLRHVNGKFAPVIGGIDHHCFSNCIFWNTFCFHCISQQYKKLESHFPL